MGTWKKNRLFLGSLTLSIAACIAISSAAHAVERYPSTVDDGTLKVMRGNTKIDDSDEGPLSELAAPAPKAPQKMKATVVTAAPEKQNVQSREDSQEISDRETVEESAEPTPPTNEELVENQTSPKPEEKVEAPVDPVEERLQEKKEIRTELARKEALALKGQAFDVVDSAHVPELAERLKYANDILKRFGRAYDYRITTLSEFKKILSQLETDSAKKNQEM